MQGLKGDVWGLFFGREYPAYDCFKAKPKRKPPTLGPKPPGESAGNELNGRRGSLLRFGLAGFALGQALQDDLHFVPGAR